MQKSGYIPNKPKLKNYFNWIPMGDDVVQVRSLESIFIMKGKSVVELMPHLIPLLDGSNTTDEITEKLPEVDSGVIKAAILKLTRHFMIEDAEKKEQYDLKKEENDIALKQLEFFSHFSDRQLPNGEIVDKYKILKNLKDSKCLLVGLGNLGINILNSLAYSNVAELYVYDYRKVSSNDVGMIYKRENIGEDRIKIAESVVKIANRHLDLFACDINNNSNSELEKLISTVDFVILATDLPIKSFYNSVNQLCLKYKKPWISARVGEIEMEIGPLVVPYQTPCFDCYTSRVNGNISFYNENLVFEDYKEKNIDRIYSISIEPVYSIVSNMLVLEVIKYLSSILYPICTSRVLSYNWFNPKKVN